jgi:hypothetical protein
MPSQKSKARAASPEVVVSPRAIALASIGALIVVQIGGLTSYFPLHSLISSQPFYTSSYALHFARSLMSSNALAHHFRLWSYSPSLMAGYPAGTRTEPMGDVVALWFWLWNGFSAVRSVGRAAVLYKIFVVGLLSSLPAAMASAARWLGFDWGVAALAAALAVFGTFNLPGLLMIRAGMFAFFAASFLCVAWSALLYAWMARGLSRLVLLAILAALLTYLHPLSAVLLLPAALGSLIETRNAQQFLAIAAAFALAFALSLGWLLPILLTRDIGVHFSHWWQTSRSISGGFLALLRWRLPFPAASIILLTVYGATRAPLPSGFKRVWLLATFVFCVIAYFGSAISLFNDVEPGRFEAPFYSFALPFAALGIREGWTRMGQLQAPLRPILKTLSVITVAYFALVSVASLLVETTVHGPIATSLPEQAEEVRRWITASGADSRILMESGWVVDERGASTPPYFKSDVGLLWALDANREIIGASPSEGFSTFSYANLGNGIAFGKTLANESTADFRRQLELYNIGELILWSADAKQYAEQVEGLVLLQRSDPYALYGVAGDHTYLMAGNARSIRAVQDCITIKRAKPGPLIVKYHYFSTLRTDPPVSIGPAQLDNGDPNPFIRIDNDRERDIYIYNGGFTGWGRRSAACD